MTGKPKPNTLLKPLLTAVAMDLATFACFAAFYSAPSGKGIWLAVGLVIAFLSFPFYVKVAKVLRKS